MTAEVEAKYFSNTPWIKDFDQAVIDVMVKSSCLVKAVEAVTYGAK